MTLSLLTAISSAAFGASDTTVNTEYDRFCDPCRAFKMDSKEDLKKLLGASLHYYDEKTNITEKLANRELNPFGVANQVVFCNYDFIEYMENDETTAILTQMATSDLIKTLLTNHPEAIECLKQHNILK